MVAVRFLSTPWHIAYAGGMRRRFKRNRLREQGPLGGNYCRQRNSIGHACHPKKRRHGLRLQTLRMGTWTGGNICFGAAARKYRVSTLLEHKEMGLFTGKELQEGGIELALPTYGQEILELAPLSSQN